MNNPKTSYEQKAFKVAVLGSISLHILAIAFLIFWSITDEKPSRYKPLAVMEFAHYDPDGGTPGGGEAIDHPEEVPPEAAEEKPEELTAKQPEAQEVIKSSSEDAAPLPIAPAEPKEIKKETKPKVKKKAANQAKNEGKNQGEVKPGGGPGSGQGGLGGGAGKGNPNALKAYQSKIRAKLIRQKKYPPAAEAKKIGGTATVNFTINRDGAVISSRLVKSSGDASLDQEVMALLKRCSPFPAMPQELPQKTINLTVPINFKPKR